MIEIASKKIWIKEKNEIILKTIELDSGLDCFILIDTKDQKFAEIILNKLLDCIIWKISFWSAYRDLSIALENTNSIIKNWKDNEWIDWKLNVFVWVLEDTDLIFSTIWNPSCYLIKKDREIVEVTEKDEVPTTFSFISNWEIKNEEHPPDYDLTPEENQIQKATFEAVHSAIQELPERFAICLDMYFFYGIPYQDISEITEIPVNTIKSHIFRAKQLLREKLIKMKFD